jgi:branched-chain amino acid transport system substrate-binding protein
MINRRTFAKHAGLAAVGGIVPGIASAQASREPRRIGFLMPLTGGSGKLGQMMLEGATVGVDEINAGSGAGGRLIELVQEDSQALAQQAIAGFRKLVDVNKTDVIFTGWTAVVSAIAPLASESKVMLVSASTASPAVRGISPFFQSTWMFDDETVKLILPYAKDKLKVKSLAVLTVVSDLGTALAQAVKADWTRIGEQIVAEDVHQPAEANFRPILIKLLGAKPDAIYLTSSNGKQLAQIVRQAREIGYKGIFLSYGAFEDPEVLTLGTQADGCYYSSPSYDAANPGPTGRKFVDAFQKKYSRLPNVHQANHYDLVLLYGAVADGLAKQNKALTGASFRDYLSATMPQYQGAAGAYKFNFKDGSVLRSSIVKVVRDGKFTKLDDLS